MSTRHSLKMTGTRFVLLVSLLLASPRAAVGAGGDLLPRGAGVCQHCPALPGLTRTEDDEPAGYITCLYSDDYSQCIYFPNDGAVVTSDSTPNCPAYCCDVGYTFGPGIVGCVPACQPGQYPHNGGCATCPAQTFGDGLGLCKPCPNQSSSDPGSSSCTFNCPAGQFVNNNACTTCPVGTKSSGGAVIACNSCGSNEVSSADHSSCLSCPAGTSPNDSNSACIFNCPAGQFVQNNACTACAAGTKSSGGPVTSCDQCVANTFSAAGASDCTPCPGSQMSDPGSSSCNQHCAAGQYLKAGSCSPCAAGTYSGADTTTCSTCPVNTFSGAGASSCTACPNGGTCKAGSTHSSQCAPPACLAGKYLDYGRCKNCPRGTFSSKPDSLYCEDCPADTYSDSGATHCTNCDSGFGCEARSAPGQCKRKPDCPPGQALSNHVCNICPRNMYSPGGHSPCIACPEARAHHAVLLPVPLIPRRPTTLANRNS
ncbi:hypothetical protein C8R47DRAFT_628055 [Mycena vitilis]|nr:hypothetical protein C8R47DRAFT_628055 [Mycena vitilis]